MCVSLLMLWFMCLHVYGVCVCLLEWMCVWALAGPSSSVRIKTKRGESDSSSLASLRLVQENEP